MMALANASLISEDDDCIDGMEATVRLSLCMGQTKMR
jgi:hypothetical protein